MQAATPQVSAPSTPFPVLQDAPGYPGIAPTWTSSAKDAVGCSLGPARLWFTIGYGIINEVYWPRIDIPQIRDLGFIVADGKGYWEEVKRCRAYELRSISPGTPAFEIIHTGSRYRLQLRISPDPRRDVLAIETTLKTVDPDLHVYVLLAPHLGATGMGNRARVAQHRGRTVLWAEQGPFSLALAAVDSRQQDAITLASGGYVGVSDGWQDFAKNGAMTWSYAAAGPGNVALMAELPLQAVVALGFASSTEAAATLAVSTLMQPFDNLLQGQLSDWDAWHRRICKCSFRPSDAEPEILRQLTVSEIVLRSHLDKTYPGAMVASLSIPWGDSGNERSGYHLVWPRDLVECAGALLALGGESEARDTLRYLIATQNVDGHWNQNQWLGGQSYWRGVQLDEAAFPVLLAAALSDRGALAGIEVSNMVVRALAFVACNGPSTDQDRWEENAGINTFTLAIAIAALVSGSAFLGEAKQWALDLADFWNENVERWTAVYGTDLASKVDVPGYFVRTAPASVLQNGERALDELVPIRNRADGLQIPAKEQVSTDFLQLVRFGLRQPDDPLIRDSVKVVDYLLKTDTPSGAVWRRYNHDGYGEHADGQPYDGVGQGRPWPLLTGERGHYELAAGQDPSPFLLTMAATASPGGMIPEQVWDREPILARRLIPGRPTGSAMPLAWAHAEFVKLLMSRELCNCFDRLPAVWKRYNGKRQQGPRAFWWQHAKIRSVCAGSMLVIALSRPGVVRYGIDGWSGIVEVEADATGLGFFAATLDTAKLETGQTIEFTLRWSDGNWIGEDFRAAVISPLQPKSPNDWLKGVSASDELVKGR